MSPCKAPGSHSAIYSVVLVFSSKDGRHEFNPLVMIFQESALLGTSIGREGNNLHLVQLYDLEGT